MKKLSVVFLIVGVSALTWMVYRIGPSTIWAGLLQIGWGLLLGCVLHACGLALDSVTLRACVAGKKPPLLHLIKTSVSGHAINEATPFGKAGEVTKFALLEQVMSKDDAAAALVAQNGVMFVINCTLVGIAPPLTAIIVDAPRRGIIAFSILGAVFLSLAVVGILFLTRGIGDWPFAVLKKLRIKAARVDRWKKRFDGIEEQWKKAARDRRSMVIAWTSGVLSRLCNVAESALYFGLGGGSHVVPGAFLSLAGSVATGFTLFFVPFQAGSAEFSADAIFRLAGLSSVAGVLVELARKLRRIVFITIGVTLLGISTARGKVGARARPRPGE